MSTLPGLLIAAALLFDPAQTEMIDLTHAFDEKTLYWPTSPTEFEHKILTQGKTQGGWFYSAAAFCAPEHGGTHLDAPLHFSEGGDTSATVPLDKLVAPAIVIDVSAKADVDADYRLSVADIEEWEKTNTKIAPGTIVLLRTGWSSRYPDRKRYFGDDSPGDASKLHFPSYGLDAAKLLAEERKVAAIGVDTASIDHGPSKNFPVHQVTAAANVPAFENLTNLDKLPNEGAIVIALPMKIGDGTGGPLRAIALLPKQ
jgi:kynurenine formamidase